MLGGDHPKYGKRIFELGVAVPHGKRDPGLVGIGGEIKKKVKLETLEGGKKKQMRGAPAYSAV